VKLIRFGEPGREKPGLQLETGERIDASASGQDYDESFFGGGGLRALRDWAAREGPRAPRVLPGTRLGPPIRRPSKIVCIGLNFRGHAAESGGAPPREPVIFMKATTSIVGPDDALVIPRNGTKVDWEVELAVVIERVTSYVTPEQAGDHVAGYMLHNDYSERAFQLERGGQFVKGKSADTFAPLGPYLATRDEIPDPGQLRMWLSVNDTMRQDSTTADMIFTVPALVSYVSQFMRLLPGDVISTGTPAGVGLYTKPAPVYLKAGDVVALGIEGLGESRQRVVAYA